MDSMRRPVGHLPSTVYWRRRVIVLLALALLIALVAWACSAGGGDSGDKKNAADDKPLPSGTAAAPGAITPGPNLPPGVVPPPGVTSGGGAVTPAPGEGVPAGTSGAPGQSGGAAPGPSTGGGGGGPVNAGRTGETGGATGGGSGANAPNGTAWCSPEAIRVQLQPAEAGKTAYGASETVSFKLVITNLTGPTCSVDFGPKASYVEVFSGSDRYWGSSDCATAPADDIRQLQQGDGQQVQLTYTWNWTRSNAAQCETDGGQSRIDPPPPNAAFQARGTLANVETSGVFRFTVSGK